MQGHGCKQGQVAALEIIANSVIREKQTFASTSDTKTTFSILRLGAFIGHPYNEKLNLLEREKYS